MYRRRPGPRVRPFPHPSGALKTGYRGVFWWSASAFALLSALAGAGWLLPLDVAALRATRALASFAFDRVGVFFSTLGSLEVSTALFGLLALIVYLRGARRLTTRLVAAFVATAAIEVAMKLLLPVPPIPNGNIRHTDFAPLLDAGFPYPYPSGHALRTTMLLGVLCLLGRNGPLWVVSATLLLGMAVSRVYLGVHWASDVAGGTLLGVAGLAWAFGGRSPKSR